MKILKVVGILRYCTKIRSDYAGRIVRNWNTQSEWRYCQERSSLSETKSTVFFHNGIKLSIESCFPRKFLLALILRVITKCIRTTVYFSVVHNVYWRKTKYHLGWEIYDALACTTNNLFYSPGLIIIQQLLDWGKCQGNLFFSLRTEYLFFVRYI